MGVLWTVIGIVAALLTSFGFVPQLRKMWRRKSVGDVSIGTFYQFSAGVVLWAAYGFWRHDMVIIGANLVSLLTLLAGIALYFRYREKRRAAYLRAEKNAEQRRPDH